MWKYINRLRSKPESYRKRFAFISAGVITLGIFGIWLSALPFTISNIEKKVAAGRATSTDDVSPIQAVQENLGTAFEGMKNQFHDMAEQVIQEPMPATSTSYEAQETTPSSSENAVYPDFNQSQ